MSLVGANMMGANLQMAILSGAEVRRASLDDADFTGALLDDAVLYDSSLRKAKLANSKGLTGRALAGTDLTGATLPEQLDQFPLVSTATDIAAQTQKLALLIVAACFYCWLTVGSTSDASLVLNSGTAKLPAVGVDIATTTFFLVAPGLLLSLHVYLHLHLQRLWECLAWLPARFPDGQRLDRRAFSWLLADVIRSETPQLRKSEVAFDRSGQSLSKLLIWWLVPLTIAVLLQRSLPSQHVGLLTSQTAILSFAAVFTWHCRRLMRRTLRRRTEVGTESWRSLRGILASFGVTVFLTTGMLWWGSLAFSTLEASRPYIEYSGPEGYMYASRRGSSSKASPGLPAKIASYSLAFSQSRLNADLSGSNLTVLPDKWSGEEPKDFTRIVGQSLTNRYLLGLNLKNSTLIKADFSGSDLAGSDFSGADLRMMKFGVATENVEGWGVILGAREIALGYRRREAITFGGIINANFSNADLRFASLWPFSLSGSEFLRADLRYASISSQRGPNSFVGADLRNASLSGTDWARTLFYGARLEGTDLSGVQDLNPKSIAFVVVDSRTRLPKGIEPFELLSGPLGAFQATSLRIALNDCIEEEKDTLNLPGLAESQMEKCLKVAREWMSLNKEQTHR
ncbi:pentapeptide repeat-containing protein [Ideonella azotifigens]|uniref:Pentapeptide repeat-containing protein n=1 Tax=Ideonella azotifigens TaxID=513160 RepID=A0ABN1K414_9BURK|nr:pentapeptide repeat-containing protein [Ideonella azotifigens]MCD2344885.1 pentapeptide repeat-containing protein [Ideonella azotifigens]